MSSEPNIEFQVAVKPSYSFSVGDWKLVLHLSIASSQDPGYAWRDEPWISAEGSGCVFNRIPQPSVRYPSNYAENTLLVSSRQLYRVTRELLFE